MEPGVVIAIIGILVSIGTYFAGVKRGERLERERRQYDQHNEQERREKELASKAADEYVDMVRRHYDKGPYALACIGLDLLPSDSLIRGAVHEMEVRSGTDPWSGQAHHINNVDLVRFFRYVREHKIDFFNVTVEEVTRRVKSQNDTLKGDV